MSNVQEATYQYGRNNDSCPTEQNVPGEARR